MNVLGIELLEWKRLLNGWWIRKNETPNYYWSVVISKRYPAWQVSFNDPLDRRFNDMFRESHESELADPNEERIKLAVDNFLIKMDKLKAFQ